MSEPSGLGKGCWPQVAMSRISSCSAQTRLSVPQAPEAPVHMAPAYTAQSQRQPVSLPATQEEDS